ncbi:DNA topoisomerase [Lysinibacillus sp. UGB7]|uniref:type IA DNA topoisomerase n=1 Tax=Lysinibacillus sp. UGB7 TaxID=3411039 RepID=UPI003B7DE483
MSIVVVIAEKPDAAYAIANALTDAYKECNGYLMGNNGLLITWTQGHLLTIKEPGEINPEWEDWSWDTLPILPPYLTLKPLPNAQKQLNVIANLVMNCHMIVNALDAGLEGEVIYAYLATYLKLTDFPTKRLWTASLQPSAIKKAFTEMKDGSEYQYLRNAGLARSMGDYILGINSTRSITLAGGGKTLSTGRILSPTLALIYDRQVAREQFEEEIYYALKGSFQQGSIFYDSTFKGDRLTDYEEVEKIIRLVEKQEGLVQFTDDTKSQMPPLLPNLTDITAMANQRHGIKVSDGVKILQKLYLKKLITYPRTSSRYVTPDELSLLHASYQGLIEVFPNLKKGSDINRVNLNNKRIFNPQHVQDHHAILPEANKPVDLTEDEKLVYQIIVERFFLQFQHPVKSLQRKVSTIINDYHFQTTFKKIIDYGWKGLNIDFTHHLVDDLDDDEMVGQEVDELPNIQMDVHINNVGMEAKERKTTAPSLYTEGSLMKQMEDINVLITDKKFKEALKGCGIGTSATRAETIKKLQDNGYITSQKKKLEVTKLGKTVIELLRKSKVPLLTSPELTAKWELELDEIKKGKDIRPFNDAVANFTMNFVEEMKVIALTDETVTTFSAKCPCCGMPVKENTKVYYCTKNNTDCTFFLWKKQYNKNISLKMLDDLLQKGETSLLTFTTKDKKRKYKARLKMVLPIQQGKLQLEYI